MEDMCVTGMKGSKYLFFYEDERDFSIFNKFPQHDRFLEELKKGEQRYFEFFERALKNQIDIYYEKWKRYLNGEMIDIGFSTWFNLCYDMKLKDDKIKQIFNKFSEVKKLEELEELYKQIREMDFTIHLEQMIKVLKGKLSFVEVDEEFGKYLEFVYYCPQSKYFVVKGEF